METLLIVSDCLALVGLMVWVILNEGRGNGPVTGLFRYRSSQWEKPEVGPPPPRHLRPTRARR